MISRFRSPVDIMALTTAEKPQKSRKPVCFVPHLVILECPRKLDAHSLVAAHLWHDVSDNTKQNAKEKRDIYTCIKSHPKRRQKGGSAYKKRNERANHKHDRICRRLL